MPTKKMLLLMMLMGPLCASSVFAQGFTTGNIASTTGNMTPTADVDLNKKRANHFEERMDPKEKERYLKRQEWLAKHPEEAKRIKQREEQWLKKHPKEQQRYNELMAKHPHPQALPKDKVPPVSKPKPKKIVYDPKSKDLLKKTNP